MWLKELFAPAHGSVAQATVILGLVVGAGLALGSIKIFKIGLGIAGVLFTGLLAGHILHLYGVEMNETDRRVRHLPVLHADGGLAGMVSIGDLVKARIDEALHEAEELRHYVETAG